VNQKNHEGNNTESSMVDSGEAKTIKKNNQNEPAVRIAKLNTKSAIRSRNRLLGLSPALSDHNRSESLALKLHEHASGGKTATGTQVNEAAKMLRMVCMKRRRNRETENKCPNLTTVDQCPGTDNINDFLTRFAR
jgi:hypothetical protein